MIDRQAFAEAMKTNSRPRELCQQPVPWDAKRMPLRASVEIKYDGLRVIGPVAELTSREGVPMDCVSHLQGMLHGLASQLFGLSTVFDGEYVHPSGVNAAIGDFKRGASTGGGLFVFDAIPLDVWLGRRESEPLVMRRRRLAHAFKAMQPMPGVMLGQHRSFEGCDDEAIELAAGVAWEDGLEGIVVKDLDSPYVRAASNAWMKIKRVVTIDSEVFDVDVGADGRLVALHVKGPDGRHVRLARGFSNAERELQRSSWLGRIVEWKHYGATPAGAFKSATYLRRRDDKIKGK